MATDIGEVGGGMDQMMEPSGHPSAVQYSDLLAKGTPSHRVMTKFRSTNGDTFTESSNECRIALNVPTDSFIDGRSSYLSCRVLLRNANAGATKITLDGGGPSLIKRLRLFGPDGSILSELNEYAKIYSAMTQLQAGPDNVDSYHGLLTGFNKNPGDAASVTQSSANDQYLHFSMPLLEPLLNSDKYVPAGWVKGAPLTISITFASFNEMAVVDNTSNFTAHATPFTIDSVSYNAEVLKFDSDFNASFSGMLNQVGGVMMHSIAYNCIVSNFTGTAQNPEAGSNTNERVLNLPIRYRSTRAVIHTLHDAAAIVSNTSYGNTTRRHYRLSEYVHRIGGQNIPTQPITLSETAHGDAVAEVMKVFGSLGNVTHSACIAEGTGAVSESKDYVSVVPSTTMDFGAVGPASAAATGRLYQIVTAGTTSDYNTGGAPEGTGPVGAIFLKSAGAITGNGTVQEVTLKTVEKREARAYYPTLNTSAASMFVIAQNLASYPSENLESGGDYSNQGLPLMLHLKLAPNSANTQVNSYFITDALFTLTSDGSISVSQ